MPRQRTCLLWRIFWSTKHTNHTKRDIRCRLIGDFIPRTGDLISFLNFESFRVFRGRSMLS
jgi:hypothetical protein